MKKKATARKAKSANQQPSFDFTSRPDAAEDVTADAIPVEVIAPSKRKHGKKNSEIRNAELRDTQILTVDTGCATTGDGTMDCSSIDLAVQPGKELLARILDERKKNWCGRGQYKEPAAPEVTNLGSLPSGWTWATLDQLANVGTGTTPSRTNAKFWEDGTVPWLSSACLNRDWVDSPAEFVSETALEKTRLTMYPTGTLLMAMYGEGKTRGKVTELRIAATINQALAAIVLEGSASQCRSFVKLALRAVYDKLRGESSGGVQPNLNLSIVKRVAIPLAPLSEQHRIVAEIEKQLTRLDAGVAALRRVQANLKRYRAAVLKAACEGKLVPTEAELARKERRKYEPAHELIARTEAPPRPNRWNSRSKDVIPGHPALAVGNPQTKLPEAWAWSGLVEIAKMESGHTPSRNHPEWWDGDVAWIGIADARERDGRMIHETFQHTNLEGIANSASRLLPTGTVCISRTSSVGYVVVLGREVATSQDFVNWIPTPAVTSDWLRVIFSADCEALRRFGKGSVHKTIYFPEWLSMHIGLPPLAEQTRIVAEVERRLSVMEELESVVSANLQRAIRLRQSILQKAFAGKLLVENRPAESLFEAEHRATFTPSCCTQGEAQ